MNEQDYKTYIYDKAKKVENKEDLDALLKEVIESKDLDYGKIVYAICGCMKATFNYINRSNVGGITGFQAGFVGWEMVREYLCHTNKTALKIIDYDNLLYPQCKENFDKTISEELWLTLQELAKKELKEHPDAHPRVIKHWESIVKGKVPFGYKVKKRK